VSNSVPAAADNFSRGDGEAVLQPSAAAHCSRRGNIDRIIGYNSVNLMLGYNPVEIYTPFELLNHENK
jgi:hypothetical protein